MVGHYLPTSRLGRYYQLSGGQLGDYYRPNQAYQRQVVRGRTDLQPRLGQLDTTSLFSSPWVWLGLAGAAAFFFFGKGSRGGSRRIAQLAARRALAAKELRELE